MGRYDRIAADRGVTIPYGECRVDPDSMEEMLALSHDDDPLARRVAVKNMCPCHVRTNVGPVWERLIEMAVDPDAGVRRDVVHALGDGSPHEYAPRIAAAAEALYNDTDRKVRRMARAVTNAYRRTGRVNVL